MLKQTRFTAFYSYKGGVGRSLALANLAYLMAREGRKVLIIDMDLEAPGQQSTDLFHESLKVSPSPPKGVMGLLADYTAYREQLSKPKVGENPTATPFAWQLDSYMIRSSIFDRRLAELQQARPDEEGNARTLAAESQRGSLWLMPATGKSGEELFLYQKELADWNWDRFYDEDAGAAFLDTLKYQIRHAGFDEVLIDSRTGFSDVFYTTTLLLADTVVCVSGLNRQNVQGTAQAIRTIIDPNNASLYGEKRIILIGSPLPLSMNDSVIAARNYEIREDWPGFPEWQVYLHYDRELALRERVLLLDSEAPHASINPYVQDMVKLFQVIDQVPQGDDIERFSGPQRRNPFPAIRVEYWNEAEVVNHFVDPGNNIQVALEQFMPTVVFGSRGTGKTMLARWFDYETVAFKIEQEGKCPGPQNTKQIGLWFRLDIDLLNAFNCDEKGPRGEYDLLFGQFLDLLLIRKALKALDRLGGLSAWLGEERLAPLLSREMGVKIESRATNYTELEQQIEQRLWEIRAWINNPTTQLCPFIVQSNVLLKLLVEQLQQNREFQTGGHYFAVFIDEYENFHRFQQRIVNTRLKQVKESDRVTYKLLARNDGIHTYATLAKGQPIEPTHDLRHYNLDEGISFDEFYNHIRKVVGRHLEASPYFKRRGYTDPEQLFSELSADEEVQALIAKRGVEPLHVWISKHHPSTIAVPLLAGFATERSPLRQAVMAVLVNQGKRVEEVIKAFRQETTTSKDWYHNYHMGALYWLYSLYAKEKRYAGFRQIVGIAGNNTRVALDLCYAIVERWLAEGGSSQGLPISADIQNEAIHTQSEVYFRKLVETGEDVGQIYRFVQRLGRVFEIIHKGPLQSEPEINHFKIKDEVGPEVSEILKRCRREAVLRWLPGNKQKSLADEQRDAWQLHPRYTPHFNISWRRKKGLDISGRDLQLLFFGEEEEWTSFVAGIDKRYRAIRRKDPRQVGLYE